MPRSLLASREDHDHEHGHGHGHDHDDSKAVIFYIVGLVLYIIGMVLHFMGGNQGFRIFYSF